MANIEGRAKEQPPDDIHDKLALRAQAAPHVIPALYSILTPAIKLLSEISLRAGQDEYGNAIVPVMGDFFADFCPGSAAKIRRRRTWRYVP